MPLKSIDRTQNLLRIKHWTISYPFYTGIETLRQISPIIQERYCFPPSYLSVIPTSTIIKNTFPTHHSIISQC
ncbi:hypothetical protein CEP51_005268 [Fusarium floridanum]|uniref:Uncharacterized protein n=1 Tax=Fusarium floridanum TaxID=1325733 RepID=A0A428RXJ6_9HYPO|nr:hypothetical protein CEP51_005268 [Fusarium floridanum]